VNEIKAIAIAKRLDKGAGKANRPSQPQSNSALESKEGVVEIRGVGAPTEASVGILLFRNKLRDPAPPFCHKDVYACHQGCAHRRSLLSAM